MKPIRSFSARHADAQQRAALDTMTLTERLLAHVLIELMETRTHRDQGEIATRLRRAGLSTKQIAALLDTTPESLAVTKRRAALRAAADPHTKADLG